MLGCSKQSYTLLGLAYRRCNPAVYHPPPSVLSRALYEARVTISRSTVVFADSQPFWSYIQEYKVIANVATIQYNKRKSDMTKRLDNLKSMRILRNRHIGPSLPCSLNTVSKLSADKMKPSPRRVWNTYLYPFLDPRFENRPSQKPARRNDKE